MTEGRTTVPDIASLSGLVGQQLGSSSWRKVRQEDVDAFAEATGDHQWIHVDPYRAAKGPFQTTIAHGFLTLSLSAVMLEETLAVGKVAMQVNYGIDRARFPSPVAVGSEVRGSTELVSVDPQPDGARAVVRMVIQARDAAKPACVADLVVRLFEHQEPQR